MDRTVFPAIASDGIVSLQAIAHLSESTLSLEGV